MKILLKIVNEAAIKAVTLNDKIVDNFESSLSNSLYNVRVIMELLMNDCLDRFIEDIPYHFIGNLTINIKDFKHPIVLHDHIKEVYIEPFYVSDYGENGVSNCIAVSRNCEKYLTHELYSSMVDLQTTINKIDTVGWVEGENCKKCLLDVLDHIALSTKVFSIHLNSLHFKTNKTFIRMEEVSIFDTLKIENGSLINDVVIAMNMLEFVERDFNRYILSINGKTTLPNALYEEEDKFINGALPDFDHAVDAVIRYNILLQRTLGAKAVVLRDEATNEKYGWLYYVEEIYERSIKNLEFFIKEATVY